MKTRNGDLWLESQHINCSDEAITFDGINEEGGSVKRMTFEPDLTRGYVQMKFSHAFPVVNLYGKGILSNVIKKSYQSLLHQNFNWMHKIVAYDPEKISGDRIIGSVLAVRYDDSSIPTGSLPSLTDSPGIEAVASFTKLAQGLDRVVGRHQTGRHNYAVSMEVTYLFTDCGFAVAIDPKSRAKVNSGTPDMLSKAGWEYFSWADAPAELLDTFNKKKNMIDKTYNNRRVVMLLGGLDNEIHYDGVGLVEQGAEREAEVTRMAASAPDDQVGRLVIPLMSLGDLLKQLSENK